MGSLPRNSRAQVCVVPIFVHVHHPMRTHFMHPDLSSLPRTVYPFVLPGSSFRQPCSSNHLLMSGYTLFSNVNIYHLLNDTSLSPPDTSIDPLRSSSPRPTVHSGGLVANRTIAVTMSILDASLHTIKHCQRSTYHQRHCAPQKARGWSVLNHRSATFTGGNCGFIRPDEG